MPEAARRPPPSRSARSWTVEWTMRRITSLRSRTPLTEAQPEARRQIATRGSLRAARAERLSFAPFPPLIRACSFSVSLTPHLLVYEARRLQAANFQDRPAKLFR